MTVFIVVLVAFVCNNGGLSFDSIFLTGNSKSKADDYKELFDLIEDKDGLKSIRAIHEQLDNDEIIRQYSIGYSIRVLHEQLDNDNKDGTIEPSETGDFIRVDLQGVSNHRQQQERQKSFHKKDSEITVKDLWNTRWKSEVHNWTVEVTIEWLTNSCDLPQYAGTNFFFLLKLNLKDNFIF